MMEAAAVRTPDEAACAIFGAVASKDPDGIVVLGASECTDGFVAIGEIRGRVAIRSLFAEFFTAFRHFERYVPAAHGGRSRGGDQLGS